MLKNQLSRVPWPGNFSITEFYNQYMPCNCAIISSDTDTNTNDTNTNTSTDTDKLMLISNTDTRTDTDTGTSISGNLQCSVIFSYRSYNRVYIW